MEKAIRLTQGLLTVKLEKKSPKLTLGFIYSTSNNIGNVKNFSVVKEFCLFSDIFLLEDLRYELQAFVLTNWLDCDPEEADDLLNFFLLVQYMAAHHYKIKDLFPN